MARRSFSREEMRRIVDARPGVPAPRALPVLVLAADAVLRLVLLPVGDLLHVVSMRSEEVDAEEGLHRAFSFASRPPGGLGGVAPRVAPAETQKSQSCSLKLFCNR